MTITWHNALLIHVSDLTGENAKKPRLQIDKIVAHAIEDVPEANGLRKSVEERLEIAKRLHPPNSNLQHIVFVYEIPGRSCPVTSHFTETYGRLAISASDDDRKKLFGGLAHTIQTINDIAKGKRPDLYEVVKERVRKSA